MSDPEIIKMQWIEGIGDEVTLFFLLVCVLLIGAIAWLSTGIGDQPLIRTVLILERRARRFGRTLESAASAPSSSIEENPSQSDSVPITTIQETIVSETTVETGIQTPNLTNGNNEGDLNSEEQDDPCFECNTIDESHLVNTPELTSQSDSNPNILRQRRLSFFQSRQATLLVTPLETEAGENSESEHANIEQIAAAENNAGHIRIRLKYLNDDQKLVEGKLEEQLGNFKRRHFSLELSTHKLVRLIFNGHVLQRDNETLRGYGLFDNCVVHCLVHQERTEGDSPARANPVNNADRMMHREWNMGTLLFVMLALILCMAWYCRYQYAQLFNATTTVALIGLTGILSVSLVGVYLPDQDGIRH